MAGLKLALLGIVFLVAVLSPVCVHSRPMRGKFTDIIYSPNASNIARINGSCHLMGMYNGSTISIKGHLNKEKKATVSLNIVVKVFKLHCANFLQLEDPRVETPCSRNDNLEGVDSQVADLVAGVVLPINFTGQATNFTIHSSMTQYKSGKDPLLLTDAGDKKDDKTDAGGKKDNVTDAGDKKDDKTDKTDKTDAGDKKNDETGGTTKSKRGTKSDDKPSPKLKQDAAITIGKVNTSANKTRQDGVYLVQVYVERLGDLEEKIPITATVKIEVHNPHGYLSAVDYPALVFFGIMTSVYAIFGISWIVMMLCSFNDLVRLQFWVLAVIILGFLEKTFFVAEYSAINLGTETYGFYFFAEFVSAIKRGLSRMLLIIVAMGFGTVKPRLGDSLVKVVGVGVAFIVLAFIDGIMRARSETFHTSDTSSVVTLALLLLLDTAIFYWIFTAIVDTRRTLRLRKNYVKLAMYNHFAYTLMFAIIATIGFLVWVFVDLEYPSGMCLTDWREVWLRDCFWHVLFAFILLVVMVIWRPSSNRSRFAYTLVTDADDDEVLFEQGNNKNFDTVKMRTVSKPGSDPPPPVTSQAEDDLRWVEENLPTTAMDKALPLLLDSDEEVMTTKFEMSKMN